MKAEDMTEFEREMLLETFPMMDTLWWKVQGALLNWAWRDLDPWETPYPPLYRRPASLVGSKIQDIGLWFTHRKVRRRIARRGEPRIPSPERNNPADFGSSRTVEP